MKFISSGASSALVALAAFASVGCTAALAEGPSKSLRLRHVVLYQNGIGYFERTGDLTGDRLGLKLREREVDDVLKSVVVVEEGLDAKETPATVSALLPRSGRGEGPEEPTELELVFSPRPRHPVSIAYAVPTAAWKATYRIILPTKEQTDKRALLQAWALIDNIGDEDWKDVRVTLATGAPLSYASDLRSPTLIERPELKGVYGPQSGINGPVYAENTNIDRDADGIPDQTDACPNERGAPNADPGRSGCPSMVRLAMSEIKILTQVFFDKGSDRIKPESKPILDEVARVLEAHPELSLVEVEGHAATDESNVMDLSMRRAVAVRAALVKLGVQTQRLSVRAYGVDKPIDSNTNDEGRARNRRVGFRLVERSNDEGWPSRSGTTPPVTQGGTSFTPEALGKIPEGARTVEAASGSYRYEIANAVTLPKKSSALITLINRPMNGDDVLLFRPDPAAPASSTHPFRAAEIENGSDIGLQAGSVSIFSGGTFVGEGVINRLSPGERATIPYAIDDTTKITISHMTLDEPVRIVALTRGVLRVTDRQRYVTTYDIEPGFNVPGTLLLRHGRTLGYEPTSLPEGAEKKPDAVFVRVPIESRKSDRVVVEESRPVERTWYVQSTDGDTLALYVKGTTLPAETQKRLDRIIDLRKLLGKSDDELERMRKQRQDAMERAAELRENIKAIEKTTQADKLKKMLLERLEGVTKQADELAAKITQRGDDAAIARAELDDALRELVIEESKASEKK